MAKQKTYDFVVIGSGPGGSPFAWRLANKGLKVLVLEAGTKYDPSKDYSLAKNDWELERFPVRTKLGYEFGESQTLDQKYIHLRSWNKANGNINNSDKRRYVDYQHVIGVGGTTLHYQGESHRIHPTSFKTKSKFGKGYDWPIEYKDLDPYYTEAEKIIGVAGPRSIPGRSGTVNYPLPPHKLGYSSQVMEKVCKKLGYNLVPNSVAILSQPYRNTAPCNYCSGCVWGCPRKDKGSVDVTFVPLAEKTGNCEIRQNAFVSRIEVQNVLGKKVATGVHYFDKEGKENFVSAKNIAVACGAVQTPRLLLNSDINASGQVGKNFMETLFYEVVAMHPERLDSYRGIPMDSIIWDWNESSVNNGIYSGGFRLFPTAGSAMGPISYATHYFDDWGKSFVDNIDKWFGHAVAMGGIGEFLPNKNSFVTISDKRKDKHGIPIPIIQSFLSESELNTLDRMAKKCKEILRESGTDQFVEVFSTYDLFAATHVFGTCIMGNDPDTSVVNPELRSHEVSNLFVTDASVFPSSGGGEAPSLTIEALSLRAADLFLKNS